MIRYFHDNADINRDDDDDNKNNTNNNQNYVISGMEGKVSHRVAQIVQNSRGHLEVLGARKVL
jgi:hypothetical protein